MKTFIVYDLDTGLPVAIGEAIKAEWARTEFANREKILSENLLAEEIDLRFDITSLAFCDKKPIQKNSKPNPRIMRRPNPPKFVKTPNGQSIPISNLIIAENQAALECAERYSKAIRKIQQSGMAKSIPTFEEWLKDTRAKEIKADLSDLFDHLYCPPWIDFPDEEEEQELF